MYNLIKTTIVLMVLSGTMMTAQAGTTLGIGATVTSKLELNVMAADRSWLLDPDSTPFTDTILAASGISVKANKLGWTVNVAADKAKLTEYTGSYGTKTLASAMSLQADPVAGGTGYTVSMTTSPQLLWGAGPKGSAETAGLKFTQPVSFDDEPLTTGNNYRSVLTFTLAAP